jgi:hypothetical protein
MEFFKKIFFIVLMLSYGCVFCEISKGETTLDWNVVKPQEPKPPQPYSYDDDEDADEDEEDDDEIEDEEDYAIK